MTSSTLVALKIVCLIIYREEIVELYNLLDGHITDLLKKEHLSHFVLHKVTRYRYLSLGGLISVFIVNFIFNIMPIVKIISNYIHQVQPNYHIFPYPSWFPWPIPFNGIVYRLHFVYETLTSVTVIIVSPGVDSIFVFFVFLMISQLREISYAITHIDEKNGNNIIVKKCINQYCILLKCRDNLEKIYGPIILCLMTTNAIVLCTSIYQISQMQSISIFKIILFFAYITVKLIQTYMYSWCGTHLTMESEECRNAIYAANWYGDKRFMNSIMIMLQQRPLVITACNMSIVSIDIFSKIAFSPGVDSIFAFFIFLMIGELREIAYNITHLKNEHDNNLVIKRCIGQYCKLIKYCDTIQKIYGPIIICLMTTNAIVMCTSMYQITQMHSISILKLSLFFTYMTLKIIQTYMYSWCGTHLTMESEECRNAIYSANWYGDKRFMNAITIMLQQRPLVLTACNLATVSVDIFTKIMNTTISYYFLLKTLE
ncbi:uncharacterized protein [Chelonus insularis]|uniref:uncharacterized protein n=1 Tax=Chelonus insularis TaxID=460826 RepID=UPI00158A4767|nr:uncharacterized protein LOC118064321 [Chelonus insularis]